MLHDQGSFLNALPTMTSDNVNEVNQYGQSALHFAAELGDEGVVKELIERGCSIHHVDFGGCRAIDIAVAYNRAGIVSVLLKKQEDPNLDITPLVRLAVEHNAPHSLQVLIDSEFPVNIGMTYDGHTILHIAAIRGFNDVVKILVKNNVMRDALLNRICTATMEKRHDGATALALAARYTHIAVVTTLIEYRAATDCRVKALTVMHHAAFGGNEKILQNLANYLQNALWPFWEAYGSFPLDMAMKNASAQCVTWILDKMNTAYAQSSGERKQKIHRILLLNSTAQFAVMYGSPAILSHLLEFKFSVDGETPYPLCNNIQKMMKCQTLLHTAIEYDRNDMVVALLRFMKEKPQFLPCLAIQNLKNHFLPTRYAAKNKENWFAVEAIAGTVKDAEKDSRVDASLLITVKNDLSMLAREHKEVEAFWTTN